MKITLIRKFFISLNQSILKRKSMFVVDESPEIERILSLLYKDSLIVSYCKETILHTNFNITKEKNIYKIYLATDSLGLPTIEKIIILKNNECINIRYNHLKVLEYKSGYKWILIRTAKGLFTHSDCIKFKLGGHLLVCLQ